MIDELQTIPGVGKAVAEDLRAVGIEQVADLVGQSPEGLYEKSNLVAGVTQDKCLLYVFRCAVYFAQTIPSERDPEKLKWWNWKD